MTVEDGLRLSARLGGVGAASVFYSVLWVAWQNVPLGRHPGLVGLCLVLFVVGSAVWLAALFARDVRRLPTIASLLVIAAALIRMPIVSEFQLTGYRTDSIVLSHEAARLVMEGRNPYPVEMTEAMDRFGLQPDFTTPIETGGVVDRVTYPALNFLAHVPFLALGGTDLRYSVLMFEAGVLLIIHFRTPPTLRPWTMLPLVVDHTVLDFVSAGITDFVWVLGVCAAVVLWRRWWLAAICLGLACAVKQPPWILLPFAVLRAAVEKSEAGLAACVKRGALFAGVALGAFAVVNAPFVVSDANAWVTAVFANFSLPMTVFGEGLSLLSQNGMVALAPRDYSALSILCMLVFGALFVLWFPRSRTALWAFPVFILWFSHRGFHNYWVYWMPVAVLGVLEDARVRAPEEAWSLPAGIPRVSLTVAIVALWAAVTASIVHGATSEPSGGVVDIVRARNAVCEGWICSMRLRLTNSTGRPVEPRFEVRHGNWQPLAWERRTGPAVVESGQSAVFEIFTDRRAAMVGQGADLRVVVRDARGGWRVPVLSRVLSWDDLRESIRLYAAGTAAFRAGDTDRAIDLLERSLVAQPTSAATHLALARAYERLGSIEEARRHADRAAELDPEERGEPADDASRR